MIIYNRRFWLACTFFIFILMIAACFYLKNIQLSTRFEDFYPKKSNQWATYKAYTNIFGEDKNKIFIPVYNEKSVFDTQFIQKMSRFSDTIRSLPITEKVICPTHIMIPRRSPFGIIYTPLLHQHNAQKLKHDSLRLKKLSLLHDLFLSRDEKALLLVVAYEEGLTDAMYQEYFSEIREKQSRAGLSASLLGNGYLELVYKTFLQTEIRVSILLTFSF